jgi:hypothetical protein
MNETSAKSKPAEFTRAVGRSLRRAAKQPRKTAQMGSTTFDTMSRSFVIIAPANGFTEISTT